MYFEGNTSQRKYDAHEWLKKYFYIRYKKGGMVNDARH